MEASGVHEQTPLALAAARWWEQNRGRYQSGATMPQGSAAGQVQKPRGAVERTTLLSPRRRPKSTRQIVQCCTPEACEQFGWHGLAGLPEWP